MSDPQTPKKPRQTARNAVQPPASTPPATPEPRKPPAHTPEPPENREIAPSIANKEETAIAPARRRGRPKGSLNKVTKDIRELAQNLTIRNPAWVDSLFQRIEDGTLHPVIETQLMHYSFGKPKENVHVEGHITTARLDELSTADIARLLAQARAALAEYDPNTIDAEAVVEPEDDPDKDEEK